MVVVVALCSVPLMVVAHEGSWVASSACARYFYMGAIIEIFE